ncbi:hypothetical protein A9Q86_01910 [Flavobacteriales bacterium 33_180_T64]|mgnify:CR=1 FL=1|nr:hypothetical protein A9Q86_01910 [Flavobacteriales bacterium 33_180_T64]
MENLIEINREYNSLESLYDFLKASSSFECSKEYDIWEHRTDANGQMAQCLVIKKSGMHAVKLYFVKDDFVKVNHIIPNKMMQAYFGKSQKKYRNILEIITGKIKDVVLAGSQQKAFDELETEISKAGL